MKRRSQVAGVHAPSRQILDQTNDDRVVCASRITSSQFASRRRSSINTLFGYGRKRQPALDDLFQLNAVVSDSAARTAKRERGSNNKREFVDRVGDLVRVLDRMRDTGAGDIEPDPQHRFLEKLPVFAFRDGLRVRADEFHVVPGQRAVAVQLHGNVERGLAAHRRQDRVRFFPGEDSFHHFWCDRLDVRAIGEFRSVMMVAGFEFTRTTVTLLSASLAGLDAGIIELAALPDH